MEEHRVSSLLLLIGRNESSISMYRYKSEKIIILSISYRSLSEHTHFYYLSSL